MADLLTLPEAAKRLRRSEATLRYWRSTGIGPPGFRLGRGVVYDESELERWIEKQREADRATPAELAEVRRD